MGRTTLIFPWLEWGVPHQVLWVTGPQRSFPRVNLKAGQSLVGLGHGRRVADYLARAPANAEPGLLQTQELGTETQNLRKSRRP